MSDSPSIMRSVINLAYGMNIDGVQKSNRCLVLSIMLDTYFISRAKLAQRTDLNKATITNIINEFIEMGIIEECGKIQGEHGRKTDGIRLDVPKPKIISLRITRKYFEIVVFDLNGFRQNPVRSKIDAASDITLIFGEMKYQLDRLIDDIGVQSVLGICMAVPGPFIQSENSVSLVTGFEQLNNINFKKEFEKEYDFPVFIEHDCKLAAFAEWKYWSQVSKMNEGTLIHLLSTGQGVGAGIVVNGKMIKGALGTAGEIGHMGINFNGPVAESGNRGIFEYYSSAESTRRYMLDRLHEFDQSVLSESSTLEDIYLEYSLENPLAVWAVERTAWYLGYGIAGLVSLLNPNIVIIGVDYPRSQKFLDAVRASVRQLTYSEIYEGMTIDFSQIEGDVTLLGGYSFVVDSLIHSKQIYDQLKRIISTG